MISKLLYMALGIAATGLGVLGVWVPGLPTTVFILIALWAFSNSSERMYRWLVRIPILESAIKESHRFQRDGTVDIRAKIVSQACTWVSFVGVTLVFQNVVISIVVGLLALSCSIFMYWVPTKSKSAEHVR